MRYYAGIGSRECPEELLNVLVKASYMLSRKGFVLRSGGADGCDRAFEYGCDVANGQKEIYLPWRGFNGSNSDYTVTNKKAFEIASQFHPRYSSLKDSAKLLQARNSHQVLGYDLETPSEFILCYTKNGKGGGGTGQALRIANYYNIPIFDFGKFKDITKAKTSFIDFIKPIIKGA